MITSPFLRSSKKPALRHCSDFAGFFNFYYSGNGGDIAIPQNMFGIVCL